MNKLFQKLFENNVSMTVRPELNTGYLTFDLRKGNYCTKFGLGYDESFDSNLDMKYIVGQRIDIFLKEYEDNYKPETAKKYYVCFDRHSEAHVNFKDFVSMVYHQHPYIIKKCDVSMLTLELKDGTWFRFVGYNNVDVFRGFRGRHISYTEFIDIFFDKVRQFKKENDND